MTNGNLWMRSNQECERQLRWYTRYNQEGLIFSSKKDRRAYHMLSFSYCFVYRSVTEIPTKTTPKTYIFH